MDRTSFDVWGGVLLAPVLIVLSVPALRRQAAREADPGMFRLLLVALIVKLAGSVARYYVAFSVYGGAADAARYHSAGLPRRPVPSPRLQRGPPDDRDPVHRERDRRGVRPDRTVEDGRLPLLLVAGVLGPVPLLSRVHDRGAHRAAPLVRLLLFFLPSLVFWPSSTGKEAWMMFSSGVAAFGVAKILGGSVLRGLIVGGIGLWLAGMVRPPMAG